MPCLIQDLIDSPRNIIDTLTLQGLETALIFRLTSQVRYIFRIHQSIIINMAHE